MGDLGKPRQKRAINWRTIVDGWSGTGQLSLEWVKGLSARGWNVSVVPTRTSDEFCPLPSAMTDRYGTDDRTLPFQLLIETEAKVIDQMRPDTIVWYLWETTRLNPKVVFCLNHARAVITASKWQASCFSASGVVVPIFVVPLGIDSKVFYPPERPVSHSTLRIGTAGILAHGTDRKCVQEVIDTFRSAFTGDHPTLSLKLGPHCTVETYGDKRIDIVRNFMTPEKLADWYRNLHVYVCGSRAEGWGLHMHQAMACGCYPVACEFGGHTEYFDTDVGAAIPYSFAKVNSATFGNLGHWADPDWDVLVMILRHIVDSYHPWWGQQAADRAMQFTWQHSVECLEKVLETIGPAA